MHPCYNLSKSGQDGTRVDQANTSLWGIVSIGEKKKNSTHRYDVWRLSWEPSQFLSVPQDSCRY